MRQRVLVWLCVCLHVVCMHCPCARLPVCVLGICGSLLGFYIFVCWHGVPAPRRVCVYVCACGVHVSHPLSLQQLGLLPGLLAPPPQLTLLSLSCWGTPWRRVGGGRPGRVPPWVCRCLCRRVAMNGAQISGPGSQGPEGKPLLTTPRLDDGHLLLPTDSTFSPARLFSSGVLAPASVFHSALPRVCVLASARRTGRDPPWQFLIHLPGPTMGGNLGCHRSIPKDPSDLSHSRKFSAACNFSNILVNQERLNINTATEEELMTLPGVTRPVAHSIVEYREYIGGFKKVEDLALVSGVGATKLEQVKFEICVSSKGSSAQHSPSSLRRDPYSEPQQYHLATAPPTAKVNINTATPAQLMSLRGVSEKMALSLVDYRQEHGPFKSIEDLIRLEGISSTVLDKIRPQVFAERSRPPSTHTNGGLNFTAKPHPSPTSLSLQSEDLDFPPGGPTQLISTRPSIEAFGGTRDGWPVWRLATWNLQGCSIEKANNPGVREVVCMTLLENSIKLLAVQDLIDKEALEKFCTELNQPTLPSVRKWKGPRGSWRSVVCAKPSSQLSQGGTYLGFLWDAAAGIELKDAGFQEGPQANSNGKQSNPNPYLAHFKIGANDLMLVNLCLPAPACPLGGENPGKTPSNSRRVSPFAQTLQDMLKGEKDFVILGDFGQAPESSSCDILRKEKFQPLVPGNTFTDISTKNPQGMKSLDNIWISKSLKKVFTGHWAVVREGLTNPWIPDNWSWGGVASSHCPVLAEFYADKDCNKKEGVPRGGSGVSLEQSEVHSKHER
ncbi:endonuclease/exonuclease/phosphatase family domain-containing protein 1 isoform X2 [Phascolarctos cinereus]|uniref:Endonuclease/exonuclease/phosphatase family domain-containing protein 1 n=1 Tax=Phascolarctos cinereus TaxID=38626 RepID=A0A6P5IFZ1_PHACI|nr:endonuclease/exonuclease/phosphatase family domain-containing protein 1 isoform X2 [Phascolarctos cinereus]